MIERINGGDKQALKELLTRYTKPIYERALKKTGDDKKAKDITRDTLNDIVAAANAGACPKDVSPWIMSMVDGRCDDVELSAILEDVLNKDPVGWNGANREPAWEPDAAWDGEETQSIVQSAPVIPEPSVPVMQPIAYETAAPAIQTPAEPEAPREAPVYAPPQFTPVYREQEYTKPPQTRPPQPRPQERQERQPDTRREEPRTPAKREEPKRTVRAESARDAYQKTPQRTSKRVPELFDDEEEMPESRKKGSGGVGMVLLIMLLLVLVAALVWMLVVMLMTRGVLPEADVGLKFADWFNANIFRLY